MKHPTWNAKPTCPLPTTLNLQSLLQSEPGLLPFPYGKSSLRKPAKRVGKRYLALPSNSRHTTPKQIILNPRAEARTPQELMRFRGRFSGVDD
ncbi:MAG: hypothetical protein ACO3XI_06695 [bacterium]